MESSAEKRDGLVSDDIRMRRKYAKQQKKLEKKKKKEEEFLRNLRKPKDTKVVLADRNLLEKLTGGNAGKETSRTFEFSTSDFPELSTGKADTSKTYTVCKTSVNASRGSSDSRITSTTVVKAPEPVEPPAGDIVVNLRDLIIAKPQTKLKKPAIMQGTRIRRMLESNSLCGNMLDSSNPKRSRGKHRETKKRKFTKLKLAIIRDRILSLNGEDNKSWADMDREKFKLELDQYLSDLMKKLKLAKAERLAKVNEKANTTEVIPGAETVEPQKKRKGKKVTKYRKYCDNAYSEDLDKAVNSLVQNIVYLRERAFGRNPIKAKAKPRHVVGLREVKKCLMLHKVKMLIIAPDLEAQETVFNTIEELKKTAAAQNIPYLFALSRRYLGYALKKAVPVSALGILYYEGLEEKFAVVLDKLKEARDKWKSSGEAPTGETNIPELETKALT